MSNAFLIYEYFEGRKRTSNIQGHIKFAAFLQMKASPRSNNVYKIITDVLKYI